MVFLVRKIEVAKWHQNPIEKGAEVSADAITGNLRTKNNSISVWEISDETLINEATLAIASGLPNHIEAFDIAIFPKSTVTSSGLTLLEVPGITKAQDLINSHRDISNLDYRSLGILKNIIVESFKNDRVIRYSQKQLAILLQDAIQSGRVDRTTLPESIQNDIDFILTRKHNPAA